MIVFSVYAFCEDRNIIGKLQSDPMPVETFDPDWVHQESMTHEIRQALTVKDKAVDRLFGVISNV